MNLDHFWNLILRSMCNIINETLIVFEYSMVRIVNMKEDVSKYEFGTLLVQLN